MVEDRVSPDGRDDPGRQAENESEDDRAQGQFDGRRKQRRELVDHRFLGDHRLAEIPLKHPGQIDAVLDQDGFVEAVFLAQLLVAHGINPALPRKGLDRIARHQADEKEGQQRDSDEGRNDQADAGEDESQHRRNGKKAERPSRPPRRVKGVKAYLLLMSTP